MHCVGEGWKRMLCKDSQRRMRTGFGGREHTKSQLRWVDVDRWITSLGRRNTLSGRFRSRGARLVEMGQGRRGKLRRRGNHIQIFHAVRRDTVIEEGNVSQAGSSLKWGHQEDHEFITKPHRWAFEAHHPVA